MRYQPNSGSRHIPINLWLRNDSLGDGRIMKERHILPLQLLLEFIPQYWAQFPTSLVAPTMPANQDQNLIDFSCAWKTSLHLRLALENILLLSREAIM